MLHRCAKEVTDFISADYLGLEDGNISALVKFVAVKIHVLGCITVPIAMYS